MVLKDTRILWSCDTRTFVLIDNFWSFFQWSWESASTATCSKKPILFLRATSHGYLPCLRSIFQTPFLLESAGKVLRHSPKDSSKPSDWPRRYKTGRVVRRSTCVCAFTWVPTRVDDKRSFCINDVHWIDRHTLSISVSGPPKSCSLPTLMDCKLETGNKNSCHTYLCTHRYIYIDIYIYRYICFHKIKHKHICSMVTMSWGLSAAS